jgi:hypothetical protein
MKGRTPLSAFASLTIGVLFVAGTIRAAASEGPTTFDGPKMPALISLEIGIILDP